MITRRHLLASGALAGIFHPRRGFAAAPPPQRFLVFGHLNPQRSSAWSPAGDETSFTLGEATRALEPWRSRLLFVKGLRSEVAENSPGFAHTRALSAILTGTSDATRRRGDESGTESTTPSVDQLVAPRLRGPARLASAEIAIGLNCREPPAINYPRAGGRSLPYLRTPDAAFNRFFSGALGWSGAPTTAAEAARLRRRRASVLDHVAGELDALARRLGKADADHVALHLDGVRDLERQVTGDITCAAGERPPAVPDGLSEMTRRQLDLIVQALACDVTRVVTFANGDSSWNTPASYFGMDKTAHDIAHGITEYDFEQVGPRIMRWSYEQMAYLLGALAAVREGERSLLDSTLILSISEFGDADTHSNKNLPVIVGGGSRGYLKTGRLVELPLQSHTDLLLTLANALGEPLTTLGDPRFCRGPLAALRA